MWRIIRLGFRLYVAAIVVEALWLAFFRAPVEQPAGPQGSGQPNPEKCATALRCAGGYIWSGLSWIGHEIGLPFAFTSTFIHEYHEEIAAIATVVIAIYTVILGVATIGLRDSAQRQTRDMLRSIKATEESAKAAARLVESSVGSSLPGLFVVEVDLGGIASLGAVERGAWVIRVNVKNFGKTLASLTETTINAGIYREVPLFPQYRPDLRVQRPPVIPDGVSFQFWQAAYDGMFTEDDLASVIDGNATFLVFGHFGYTDFLGDLHEFGFSRVWDERQGRFELDDRPRYNLRHYKQRES